MKLSISQYIVLNLSQFISEMVVSEGSNLFHQIPSCLSKSQFVSAGINICISAYLSGSQFFSAHLILPQHILFHLSTSYFISTYLILSQHISIEISISQLISADVSSSQQILGHLSKFINVIWFNSVLLVFR